MYIKKTTKQNIFKDLTVFTSNYNHGHYLERKFEQIINQHYRPSIYLIIDDASTDNSWEIIRSFAERYEWIKAHRNDTNRGVIKNTNKGLSSANSALFYPTASDDIISQNAFGIVQNYFNVNKSKGVFFGNMEIIDEDDNFASLIKPQKLKKTQVIQGCDFFNTYIKQQNAQFSLGAATYYKTDALLDVGGLSEEAGAYCDTVAINLIGSKHGGVYINEKLASWRVLENSVSQLQMKNLESVINMVFNALSIYKHSSSTAMEMDYLNKWAKKYIFETITCNLKKIKDEDKSKYLTQCKKLLSSQKDLLFCKSIDLSKIL